MKYSVCLVALIQNLNEGSGVYIRGFSQLPLVEYTRGLFHVTPIPSQGLEYA
jgi:hypothetical protein